MKSKQSNQRLTNSSICITKIDEHSLFFKLISKNHEYINNIFRVRPKISHLRDAAPLLELDRDERKLEAFLQLHKHDLLVADLRIFLPFTINLDPYLRKVLKGNQP